ncbi:MAG: sugar-binding domain-containing protein [Ignavibacteriota bacterium]
MKGKRLLLHFGAVDWRTEVWVNGKSVGTHEGGYDPFTFDITPALKGKGAEDLVVSVWDPSDNGPQPRGKQVLKPESIWYTAVSGIWQTVWLESVPCAASTTWPGSVIACTALIVRFRITCFICSGSHSNAGTEDGTSFVMLIPFCSAECPARLMRESNSRAGSVASNSGLRGRAKSSRLVSRRLRRWISL